METHASNQAALPPQNPLAEVNPGQQAAMPQPQVNESFNAIVAAERVNDLRDPRVTAHALGLLALSRQKRAEEAPSAPDTTPNAEGPEQIMISSDRGQALIQAYEQQNNVALTVQSQQERFYRATQRQKAEAEAKEEEEERARRKRLDKALGRVTKADVRLAA